MPEAQIEAPWEEADHALTALPGRHPAFLSAWAAADLRPARWELVADEGEFAQIGGATVKLPAGFALWRVTGVTNSMLAALPASCRVVG